MPIGELAALAASLVWALASVYFARLSGVMDARALNFAKTGLAAALLWLTLLLYNGTVWPALSPTDFGWLAASGFVGLAVGDTAIFRALARIGPRRTLLVWALVPPTTAALAVPVLGEPVTPPLVAGMALTLAGVVWVVRERAPDGAATDALGLVFAIVSMLCQSVGNILVKLGGSHADALEISVVRLVVGAGFVGLHLALIGRLGELRAITAPKVPGRLALATFLGTYLGIWLATAGLRYAPAAVAATLGSMSPVFVIPVVWAFDGERPSPRAVTGALVAVIGVAVLFLW